MMSMQPLWWFALPVVLLPLWWHLRKRERTRTELLATARFLPAAAPRQQRVFRFADVLLLLARLLLIVVLIAWMAVLVMPWKGDTAFIDPSLESDPWVAQQLHAAGMDAAAREPLPADLWPWLARNEHAWHPSARLLVIAPSLPLPALPPRLAHTVSIRTPAPAPGAIAPSGASTAAAATSVSPTASATATQIPPAASAAASPRSPAAVPAVTAPVRPAPGLLPASAVASPKPNERHVVVVTTAERLPRWQALFAAFGTAGEGAYRYVLHDAPTRATELIVWDRADAPPPQSWQAPLWWRTSAASSASAAPVAAPFATAPFAAAPSAQGLTWTAAQWPLTDVAAARMLYEQWQRQSKPSPAYPLPAAIQTISAQRKAPLPALTATSPDWLALTLLALFAIERILAHVRRR